MVYHIQNQWVFGLLPSSGILGRKKHDVSETGSVSVQHAYEEVHRIGWDDARNLEIERTADIENIRNRPIWHA
jgi:hypothetical protein